MKLYKLLFFSFLIMGTIMSISSYSWMSMWMGLEINLLSIIPLLSKKSMLSTEASLKYFITQAMASMVLLMAVIMMLNNESFINPLMNSNFLMIINSALFLKMGAAPFHFWFPEVMEGISWMNALLLMTWQKIAPMMLTMNSNPQEFLLISIITISLIVSTVMSFNQISLRKIMAYSSINHIAWMLSAMMISLQIWFLYFFIYMILNLLISLMFKMTNSFFLNQIFMSMNSNKIFKLMFFSSFMSLGGLPPFIGFLPKWLIINWMTNNTAIFLSIILILTTLIMLFIYMRIMTTAMILSTNEFKINMNKINKALISFSLSLTLTTLVCSSLIPFMM